MNGMTSDTKGAQEEDLSWLAIRGVELGRTHCTCSAFYHELWGPLRASGFITSLEMDGPNLASTISPLIDSHTRILIAGSADTGIFSAVRRISDKRSSDISVVDRCRAPLALIEEFASMRGTFCRTLHSDIGNLDGIEKWDLILLHYTSTFFDPLDRERCFKRLSCSLAPGGFLVSMAKKVELPAGDESRAREFAYFLAARKALRGSPFGSYWGAAKLDDMLRQYAREMVARETNYPTTAEIERMLTGIGLKLRSKDDTYLEPVIREGSAAEVGARSVSVIVAARDD